MSSSSAVAPQSSLPWGLDAHVCSHPAHQPAAKFRWEFGELFFTLFSLSHCLRPRRRPLLLVPIPTALLPVVPGYEQSCTMRGEVPIAEKFKYKKKTYTKNGHQPSSPILMNPCVPDHVIAPLGEGCGEEPIQTKKRSCHGPWRKIFAYFIACLRRAQRASIKLLCEASILGPS